MTGATGRAAYSTELDEQECWSRLGATGIGRLAGRTSWGVDIFPVNYLVRNGELFFRSAPGQKLDDVTAFPDVAFEADEHTEFEAWSVFVKGTASAAGFDSEQEESVLETLRTFADGDKPIFVRISPYSITGRTFRARTSN